MQLNIKTSGISLTPEISTYVEKKLDAVRKLINKEDSGALCEFEVGRTTRHHKSGDVFRAEINLTTEGKSFYAASEKEDLYAAIDEVKDEIRSRLLSHKTKKETLFKRGGRQMKSLVKNLRWPKR